MTDLELEEQIERIRNARVESDKFVAEQRKLIAEAAKFEREHAWYPWLQLMLAVGSSAAIGAIVARLIH